MTASTDTIGIETLVVGEPKTAGAPVELSQSVAEAPGTEIGTGPGLELPEPAFILARPSNPLKRAFLKGPILMWRLGFGPLIGRAVMVLSTTGRKSGLPRRTAVGYHEHSGRKYVFTLRGPKTDWYRNICANPHITIQTARGTESVVVRRVTDDLELASAYDFLARMPVMKRWASALDVQLSPEELIAHKDDFILLTFDPTTEPTPPPLRADLWWLRPLTVGSTVLCVLALRRLRRRTSQPLRGS